MSDFPATGTLLLANPVDAESVTNRRDPESVTNRQDPGSVTNRQDAKPRPLPSGRAPVAPPVLVPVLGLAGVEDDPLEAHIVRGID
ncbi:hypothetical protein [Streptomyces sp. TBY4]|uniref:hypothetical protein n=1 Tax=Streptomyces sp. TBY4 TaxID=2962030 RepID=UPI0020B8534A|nr:hypothetical protein [Streptomyces sp. TBY4]MCP3760668.1 hypothetical protein [Streptomyces sp. TBY4]